MIESDYFDLKKMSWMQIGIQRTETEVRARRLFLKQVETWWTLETLLSFVSVNMLASSQNLESPHIFLKVILFKKKYL